MHEHNTKTKPHTKLHNIESLYITAEQRLLYQGHNIIIFPIAITTWYEENKNIKKTNNIHDFYGLVYVISFSQICYCLQKRKKKRFNVAPSFQE